MNMVPGEPFPNPYVSCVPNGGLWSGVTGNRDEKMYNYWGEEIILGEVSDEYSCSLHTMTLSFSKNSVTVFGVFFICNFANSRNFVGPNSLIS